MTKTPLQIATEAAQNAVNTRHGLTNAEMEKAIVAAFEVLVPHRYVWEEQRYIEDAYSFVDIWDEQYDNVAPKPHPRIRNVRALYLSPNGDCCHTEPLTKEKVDRLSRDLKGECDED